MKVIVIGGVAAGTKTAAKLKREMPDAEVMILTKSADISYAGCGLPYYIGGVIKEKAALIVNTPEAFTGLTGVIVKTETEVTAVDANAKTVTDAAGNTYSYDKLVVATGASPIKPPLPGIDLPGVFCMRTPQDAFEARDYIKENGCTKAVVVGGGFIGLEVAENLKAIDEDMKVTVIDMAPQVMPGFSKDFAAYIKDHLSTLGIKTMLGRRVEGIEGDGKAEKVLTDARGAKADVVILSIGIRANTAFLMDTGIEMMPNRTLKVNEYMETSIPDIYAVGDCVTVWNRLTKQPQWAPMGSTANMEGRILAQNLAGKKIAYGGAAGTAVCHLPGLNIGKTGYTEETAKAADFDPISVTIAANDKPEYMPESHTELIKVVADKKTGKFLGAEVLGAGNVDKVVDVACTAFSLDSTVDALSDLDLAYAPPFSTAIHPFVTAIQVLMNKMDGTMTSATPEEFMDGMYEDYTIIDASKMPAIDGAQFVDFTKVNGPVEGLALDDKLMIVCTKGRRAYLLQNKLRQYGYTNTLVLEAGTTFNGTDLVQ